MLKGFRDFLIRGNAIDLGVAIVIGAAFNGIVNALVRDFITPIIGIARGKSDFANVYFSINNSKFMVGDFINNLISFFIVATVVYFFIVLPMNTLMKKVAQGKKIEPETKTCPECLSLIPSKATRCKFCTAILSK